MIGHVGRADRAEEDGIELLQLLESPLGDVGAGLDVALRAPVEILELQAEVDGQLLQHFHAGRDDFVADSVTWDRRDSIGFQGSNLPKGEEGETKSVRGIDYAPAFHSRRGYRPQHCRFPYAGRDSLGAQSGRDQRAGDPAW